MDRPSTLLEQTLAALRDAQDAARGIGVEFVGVVGSVARGEAGPTSDVDVVYDVTAEGHLWPLLGLVVDLEDRLGRRIDIVDRGMMLPERWDWMARDLVPL